MLSVDEAIKIILEQTPCPTATTQVDLFSELLYNNHYIMQ